MEMSPAELKQRLLDVVLPAAQQVASANQGNPTARAMEQAIANLHRRGILDLSKVNGAVHVN